MSSHFPRGRRWRIERQGGCGQQRTNTLITAVDAVALIVQIHLQQNRNDLAVKEVTAAKRWAQDNIIVNLAESWVGLRLVSFSHNIPALMNYYKTGR